MPDKKSKQAPALKTEARMECCKVEAVVSVDERGQMILPKELRQKAGIRAGDKLAVVAMEKKGTICCLSLIKVQEFAGMISSLLGPLIKESSKE